MEVFVVSEKYIPYKASILVFCSMRTLAVFNDVQEANAYAQAHVRELEHQLHRIDMYDQESCVNEGSRPHRTRGDGTLMWQVNWGHVTIVNVEKSHVHSVASHALLQEPILVYDEQIEVNLEADVDTKANYEREIMLKIEADDYQRHLEFMLRTDPHEYERLRAMQFEVDDEEGGRVVLKEKPVEESGTAVKVEGNAEDGKQPDIKSEAATPTKSGDSPSASRAEESSKPRVKVEEEAW